MLTSKEWILTRFEAVSAHPIGATLSRILGMGFCSFFNDMLNLGISCVVNKLWVTKDAIKKRHKNIVNVLENIGAIS